MTKRTVIPIVVIVLLAAGAHVAWSFRSVQRFAAYLCPSVLAGSEVPFEPTAWASDRTPFLSLSLRCRMAPDVVRQKLTLGMTRSAVVDLLGPPTSLGSGTSRLNYWLKPGFLDPIVLSVGFDEQGLALVPVIRED
jgi:hypothetical protein